MGAIAMLLPFAQDLIKKLFPDPAAQAEAQFKLAQMAQNGELAALAASTELAKGQQAINLAEAQRTRMLMTWREGFGWIVVLAVAFKLIGGPAVAMVFDAFGHPIKLPELDMRDLWAPFLTMLGIDASDTIKKVKGV